MTPLLHDAFAHHLWATERIIDACEALSPEQLETPAPGTFGSVIATLRHLVGADGWYLMFFRTEGVAEFDEEGDGTLAEMRAAMAANAPIWLDLVAGTLDADADVVEHGDGWDFHAPLGLRLAQVIQHGTDHRSQVCTALTSFGIEPPEIDLWAYGKVAGRTRGEER